MPQPDIATDCTAAREWVSAYRDGEAFDERVPRDHTEACTRCATWVATLDAAMPRLRMRRTGSPHVISAALLEWDRQAVLRGQPAGRVGRVLLGVAGVAGMVFAVLGLLAVPDSVQFGPHLGWELYSFEAILSLGFLLTARRPDRYGPALLPLVIVIAALTMLPAVFDAAAVRADPVAEASHATVLIGLLGLLVCLDARRRGGVTAAPGGTARRSLPT